MKKNKINQSPLEELVEDEEFMDHINKEIAGIEYTNKERVEAIKRFYSNMLRQLESEDSKFEIHFRMYGTSIDDTPLECIGASWGSKFNERYRRRRSIRYAAKKFPGYVKRFGIVKGVKYLNPFRKFNEIVVTGSLGGYYRNEAFDPTISEAFDTGFYTCMRLLMDEIISFDDIPQPKDSETDS